jgi:hypothetical protein
LSLKGLWLGLRPLCVLAGGAWGLVGKFDSWLGVVAWYLLVPAVRSFISMIYTGSTTCTSLSGVRYEMRVPIQSRSWQPLWGSLLGSHRLRPAMGASRQDT